MKLYSLRVVAPAALAFALSACVGSSTPPPASSSSSSFANSSAAQSSSEATLPSSSSSAAANAAPTVAFTSPPANYSFTQGNASYSVVANADDADGNLATVSLYIDDELIETLSAPSWRWLTAVLNDLSVGEHTLKLVATDTAGESATSERKIEVLDTPNVAPSVTITSPSEGEYLQNGSSVDVTANASDSDGTIQQVTLYLNNQVIAADDAAPYRWPASVLAGLQNLNTGNYTLRAVAEDNDGATADDSVSFEIAEPNDFPSVAFAMPANNLELPVGTTLDVIANASDTDGSIAEVRFYVNGTLVGADKNYPYEWFGRSYDEIESLASGTYSFSLEAEDDKGGITTASINVNILANADKDAGDPARGELQYMQMCLDCHGQFGEGYNNSPSLVPLRSLYEGQSMAAYINDNMPNNFVTNCQDQCARNVATYMQESLEAEHAAFIAYVGDAERGAERYTAHCAECHGPKGLGGDLEDVIFPLRDTRSYSLNTFYFYTNNASLFSLIDLGKPLGPNGYPEGHAQQCEGQCVADVIAHLKVVEAGLNSEEKQRLQIASGKRWYEQQCSGCHNTDGTRRGIIPLNNSQRNNDSLDNNDPLYYENRFGMPPSDPDSCGDDCARDVTVYIREVLDK